jgi:hypothetical protein
VGLLRLGSSFGLGYVLGSRAGRPRYEQLLGGVRRLLQHPRVQEASSRLPAVVQQRLPATGGPEHSASAGTAAGPSVPGRFDGITGPVGEQTQTPPPRVAEPLAAELPPGFVVAVPPEQEGLSSNRPLIDPVVVPGRGLPRSTRRKLQ